MKRVLVTGCAGFIGSAFVRMLSGLSPKHEVKTPPECVVGLDAFRIGSSQESYQDLKNLEMIKGDICDAALVKKLLDKYKFDTIINFAAESHVDRSIESSSDFLHSNVTGVLNLLEAIKDRAIRFVQVSTDEVYGTLGDEGSFEETMPLLPNSPYSASKAAADLFVRSFIHTHKVDALITRCSNNYGPFQFPEKFMPVVIMKALQDKKIPIYGTGKNVRDWIYVDDHAWGVYLTATRGLTGEIYNFGGHGEADNLSLAKNILKQLQKSEDLLEFVQDRKGHDWRYCINSTKAKKELGWMPLWDFDTGLKFTIDWYVTNMNKWSVLKKS